MEVRKSIEFRAESLKQFGLILGSPLGLHFILFTQKKIKFSDFIFTIEGFISLALGILGFMIINRSLQIIHEEEQYRNGN
ncbi:MAG: hypothetical protein MK033_05710 [Candidatus Caenarcaniphilales bacterium]|nr:hypothetical protein [Candidatus Caenarcaniphilales bacterium]